MSHSPLARTAGFVLLPLALIAGCAPTTPPPDEETVVTGPTAEPNPVATPEPIADDAVVIIRASAADSSGAALDLVYQVRLASPWDYQGTQSLPLGLLEDCGGELDEDVFASEEWSFTRGTLTAILADSSTEWDGSAVAIEPTTENAYIAGRLILATPPAEGELACATDKSLTTPGAGAIAVGLPGDAASLTAWAGFRWGFRSTEATLSNCTFEVTELGKQYGAGAGWVEQVDDSTCVIGPS